MDLFLEQAKAFAQETAKASQQLAKEAAKRSKEMVTETAKKSKEFAGEATRRADQLKALAGELPLISAVTQGNASGQPSEVDLQKYGITRELQEFVKGLTMETFREFPLEQHSDDQKTASNNFEMDKSQQLLTDWEEHHALLILHAVPDMSKFRYTLCPRLMKERRFWTIYFRLVSTYLQPYLDGTETMAAPIRSVDKTSESSSLDLEKFMSSAGQTLPDVKAERPVSLKKSTSGYSEQDLDAFLLGDSESEEETADGNEHDGFDVDLDELVDGTESDSGERVDKRVESSSSVPKTSTFEEIKDSTRASESSSDGELLELPTDHD